MTAVWSHFTYYYIVSKPRQLDGKFQKWTIKSGSIEISGLTSEMALVACPQKVIGGYMGHLAHSELPRSSNLTTNWLPFRLFLYPITTQCLAKEMKDMKGVKRLWLLNFALHFRLISLKLVEMKIPLISWIVFTTISNDSWIVAPKLIK
jgi:hypothetical protein